MSTRRVGAVAAMVGVGLVGVGLLGARPAGAREYGVEIHITTVDELYDLQLNGDIDQSTLDLLVALYNRPLDINRADRYLLYDLPGVSLKLADAIVSYRAAHGRFTSVDELLEVPGFDKNLLDDVLPFIRVARAAAPVGAKKVAPVQGTATLGSVWLQGFGRKPSKIDPILERSTGPQGYLRFSSQGFDHYSIGGLVTYRRRTLAHYDLSRGAFVTPGPGNRADLDSIYATGGWGPWGIIVGSYTVGFGQSVVFDDTSLQNPDGWRENDNVSVITDAGHVSPQNGLFGAAVSATGLDVPGGWLDATAFASSQLDDLYQYDFNYGLDPYFDSNGSCQTDGDCPAGYSCGPTKQCVSTAIYNGKDLAAPGYRYETYYDAFRETLGGVNTTYHLNERTQVGVTAWGGGVTWQLASIAQPRFARSAKYPNRPFYGAYGASFRWGAGFVDVAGEYGRTFGGGNGGYVQAIVTPARWFEGTLALRAYDAHFKNPHTRAEAEPDESLGARARNEQGVRVQGVVTPGKRLSFTTGADLWRQPMVPLYAADGSFSFVPVHAAGPRLVVSERVSYRITRRENIELLGEYANRDLRYNSRHESYTATSSSPTLPAGGIDACYHDLSCGSKLGRGERRKVQVGVATSRIPRLTLRLTYAAVWEDVARYAHRFDLQHRMRVQATVQAWPGASLAAYGAYWLHARYTNVSSDRQQPQIVAYAELRQQIGEHVHVAARYGVYRYIDSRASRYAWYHLGKLEIAAKF